MRNLLLGIGILLLVALLALAGFVYFRGEEGLRRAAERHGPRVFGAPVDLDRVSLSLLTGGGRLEGLAIWNPEGFSEGRAIQVDRLSLDLRIRSLLTDVYHIEELVIARPLIRIEVGREGLNVRRLQRNVEESLPPPEAAPETRVIIRELRILEPVLVLGSDTLDLTELDLEALALEDRTLVLPDVHVVDIGGSEGVSPERAARQVLDALLGEVERVLATEAGRRLLEAAGSRLEELEELVPEALRERLRDLLESDPGR